jgi:hypothetical protein
VDPTLLAILRRSADAQERLATAIEGQTAALAKQANAITALARAVGQLAVAGDEGDTEAQDEDGSVVVQTFDGPVRVS